MRMTDGELYKECHRRFEYRDGSLYYKASGTEAGFYGKSGYISVTIDTRTLMVHRLIFLMHHKYLPKFIDHIDMNKVNNYVCNLRPVSRSANAMNSKVFSTNTSGFKGVSLVKESGRYRGTIHKDGTRFHLGVHDTPEEAAKAYDVAALEKHGEFARLNFPKDDYEHISKD